MHAELGTKWGARAARHGYLEGDRPEEPPMIQHVPAVLTNAVAAAPSGIANDLFDLQMPVLEKVIRTVVVYLGIGVIIRVAGKRLLAQMNSLDLVVVLLLSNVVQNAIIGWTTPCSAA